MGERTSTYSLSCIDIVKLHTLLAATAPIPDNEDDVWRRLVEDVRQVPPDSVVFNWECCSGCGYHAFPCSAGQLGRRGSAPQFEISTPSATMQFMGFALRSGFTVMCSDFSLKSLIHEWSEEQLGPNPFLQVGSCNHQFLLEFDPAELQQDQVPQQLQVVGELCAENGKAVVEAMDGTIVYTVNPKREDTQLYELKVLTVVTDDNCRGGRMTEEQESRVGQGDNMKSGAAGHVTLTYKDGGGQLVTSNGHWIELTRINTSLESVMRAAAHNFGNEECRSFQCEWENCSTASQQSRCVQRRARKLVQQSLPSRHHLRTKFSS